MSWLQLFQCQGIWKQNIESICTATYCQESNITVDIPFTEKSFYHLQNTKRHSITAGILNSLLFFYIIQNCQDPGKTNFPAAVSGVGSSHQRNKLFSFAEPEFSLVYVYCQTNHFTWRWRGQVVAPKLLTLPCFLLPLQREVGSRIQQVRGDDWAALWGLPVLCRWFSCVFCLEEHQLDNSSSDNPGQKDCYKLWHKSSQLKMLPLDLTTQRENTINSTWPTTEFRPCKVRGLHYVTRHLGDQLRIRLGFWLSTLTM